MDMIKEIEKVLKDFERQKSSKIDNSRFEDALRTVEELKRKGLTKDRGNQLSDVLERNVYGALSN